MTTKEKPTVSSKSARRYPTAALLVERVLRRRRGPRLRMKMRKSSKTRPCVPAQPVAKEPANIWELAERFRSQVPAEDLRRLPKDGAEQHDHYIYGTPKRA
jgi:hypothetical protein